MDLGQIKIQDLPANCGHNLENSNGLFHVQAIIKASLSTLIISLDLNI